MTRGRRVVVVTGAAGGIGRAIVRGFRALGDRVVPVDCVVWHREILQPMNLVDPEVRVALLARLRRVDVLVQAAGVSLPLGTPARWTRTLDVNLLVPVVLAQAVARGPMRKYGGAIVNITSIGAHVGFPGNVAYQASKGGLRQATRAMAVDFGRWGIRVNNVCPGYIRTAMTRASWKNPVTRHARTARTILGRWGRPADVVGAVLFLASDAARYITGIDLPVDGGWLAKGL